MILRNPLIFLRGKRYLIYAFRLRNALRVLLSSLAERRFRDLFIRDRCRHRYRYRRIIGKRKKAMSRASFLFTGVLFRAVFCAHLLLDRGRYVS